MSENHREPEVPGEEAPVVECIDGLARITSKELAITHFVKSGTMLVLQDQEWLTLWEKCSYAHRQVDDEQPTKKSKKNDDESAVAMLKKGDWHQSVRELVINYVKGHDRSVNTTPKMP